LKTLIRNATVVLPGGCERVHVLVEGSTIAAIDAADHARADTIVDASGLHLLPGVIDDQVHFREPGLTHKEDLRHASRACAKGGVTSFLDMPNTKPTATNRAALEDKRNRAAASSLVNFGFFIGATPDNLEELQEAERAPGIKVFLGSSTGELLVDDAQALERIFAETTLPIAAHCEDEATIRENASSWTGPLDVADHSRIRDARAAWIATRRATDLARKHGHRLHVLHLSTAAELDLLADHRGRITAEVCPHHLFFHTGDYARLGSLVQMNPSLKTAEDNEGLWKGLLEGTIQVVATDHAPHTLEEKARPYPQSPSGLPAVENSLALFLDQVNRGRCAIEQVVRWMCDAPARVWDMVGKGRIEVGYDADLVLVDLARSDTIVNDRQETKCRWSPWHGTTLRGWPVRTWVLGREVFRDGRFDESVRGGEIRFDHARGGYWAG